MDARPIVVGYDASPDARAALRWALDEARRTAATVRLVYAFDWYVGPMWLAPGPSACFVTEAGLRRAQTSPGTTPVTTTYNTGMRPRPARPQPTPGLRLAPNPATKQALGVWPDSEARADARAMLANAVAEAAKSHPAVTVTPAVVDGPAQLRLRDESKTAAMLVLGGRGNGGFPELLVGSTAVSVSSHADCPVIVVRATEQATEQAEGGILVGVDGSPCAQAALEWAFERAVALDAPLTVVEAWSPPSTRFVPAGLDLGTIARTIHVELDDLVGDWRQKFPQVRVATEVHTGGAAAHLVAASAGARLVVVGSRGRGTVAGTLLGSVSQELIHHAHCPVAIVRTARHAGPAR